MLIDAYLKQSKELDDHALHLLFSANRWEQREVILDRLRSGISVVVDRYAYSGKVCLCGGKWVLLTTHRGGFQCSKGVRLGVVQGAR